MKILERVGDLLPGKEKKENETLRKHDGDRFIK
jgi:hypothetical protein